MDTATGTVSTITTLRTASARSLHRAPPARIDPPHRRLHAATAPPGGIRTREVQLLASYAPLDATVAQRAARLAAATAPQLGGTTRQPGPGAPRSTRVPPGTTRCARASPSQHARASAQRGATAQLDPRHPVPGSAAPAGTVGGDPRTAIATPCVPRGTTVRREQHPPADHAHLGHAGAPCTTVRKGRVEGGLSRRATTRWVDLGPRQGRASYGAAREPTAPRACSGSALQAGSAAQPA